MQLYAEAHAAESWDGLPCSGWTSDDDDAPDQGRWWGKLHLSQFDAPTNTLDQSQSVSGSHKALAAQHTEVPQDVR